MTGDCTQVLASVAPADDTLLAHQHGACSWAERDTHAGALAAAAAAEAEAEEAEQKKNDEKEKARVRDRRRRARAKAQVAELLRRNAALEAMLGRCAGDGAERWYGAVFFGVSYSFLTRSLSPSHPLSPHSTHPTAHRQQQQATAPLRFTDRMASHKTLK